MLKVSAFSTVRDREHPAPGGFTFTFDGGTATQYANFLQQALVNRPVANRTGLPAETRYDFDVTFMPDDTMFGGRFRATPEMEAHAAPNFFTALTETTGLKLAPDHASIDVLVIDHAEAPTEN